MQIEEKIGVTLPGSVEGSLLEDVVVLAGGTGVSHAVQRAFCGRVRDVRDGGSGLAASRYVEIPLVGSNGEVSGILCRTGARSNTRDAVAPRRRERARAIADVAQFVVHDINNLLAVIDSGLRLLECQTDAAHRKAIVGKMQEAIARGASLSRQILDVARPYPKSIDEPVSGRRLAAIASTLDRALRADITVRTEIAPDLWQFNAAPEELYFALLNLCRNSADAMPGGGAITVMARNVEASADSPRGFVEIVVADDGEGMPEDVLSQAFTPHFTTKAACSSTGLGLPQVQRFAEGRGGAVYMESEQGAGTLVRLFLPRAHVDRLSGDGSGTEIAYTPSADGGVFHVVDPVTAGPTS